jgi:transglutaminase-like putative cysteine protease
MSEGSIGALRKRTSFMRSVSCLVLLVYAADVLSPGAQALAREIQRPSQIQVQEPGKAQFGQALGEVKEHLRVLAGRSDALKHKPSASERNASKGALRAWRESLRTLDAETQAEFDVTEKLIREKQLPDVIRQRHAAAVAKYRQELTALQSDLEAAVNAPDEATIHAKADSAFKRLDSQTLGRKPQHFDPHHLPNSSRETDPNRKPRVTSKEFLAAGLTDNPQVRLASINPFDISHFPSASNPAYLAATTEVTLSPDIVAKASALNGDPVAIYNWVRNNVQWQPTWGAIQDASHTLSTRQGNAFDIASLMIALLRASGIPARYVHGTIAVPADQFRNWAGGFQSIDAALDFAASGGIPVTAITAGGQIASVRMEHVWVEAAVDFIPSRGAVNKSADSWVALDPSFKQVRVLQGLNVAQISGVDSTQVLNTFLASGTTNQTEGWATGFDTTIPKTALTTTETSLEQYVNTNLPNATVGDVFGGRKIIVQKPPVLPASLPNHLVVVGARYATLPAQLEQQITFAFGMDIDGTPLNPQTFPWPQLNNQQVILSFRPATQADQDALTGLLPPGTITDPSQLPASIPAYLINVVPEIKVNGTVIMTGNAIGLGQDLDLVFDPTFVSGGLKSFDYSLPAGSYVQIAVIAGSVNPSQVNNARNRLQATKAILQANVPAQVAALTREQMLGDLFQTGMLSYYAQYTASGYLAGQLEGGHHILAAGLGSFGYEPAVDTFFGIPRSVSSGGITFNIPIVNVVGYDGSDASMKRKFNIQLGMMASQLESQVPEQTFATSISGAASSAISAAKALSLANAAGQRIYQITSANQGSVLPLIHQNAAALAEMQAALANGSTVVAHTDPIMVPGWTGAAYIILDPDTGSGAYKIAGGQNGGFLKWVDDHSIPLLLLGIVLGAFEAPLIFAIGVILAAVTAIAAVYVFYEEMQDNKCSGLFWLFAGFGIAFALFALIAGAGFGFVIALALYGFIASEAAKAGSKSSICQDTPAPPVDDGT